ncbi:MAG TPA: cyclic nucleotide-binding domain-containing protein [Verrucomicrobiae bacterium]|nr:cyclic nucleotide-binding domain-containing protein [Verrucomicrobiae bacterium]
MQITTKSLAREPFLTGLSEPMLEILAKEAMPAEFKAGEEIFNEGGLANRFYLICSGKVELQAATNSEHQPVIVETIGADSVLGWSWLFPPYTWHFDACAITPVKAIFFYGTRLREECETNHELGHELMKRVSAVVIERLQAARHHLIEEREKCGCRVSATMTGTT